MPRPETPHSSFRIYRQVQETPRVAKFMLRVHEIAAEEAGYKDSVLHQKPHVFDDGLEADGEDSQYVRLGIPAIEVCPASDLNMNLIERNAPVSMNYGGTFARAMSRLSSPYANPGRRPRRTDDDEEAVELPLNPVHARLRQVGLPLDIPDDSTLPLVFAGVQEVTYPTRAAYGRQYALMPKVPSRTVDLIHEQTAVLTQDIARLGVGPDILYPETSSVPHVPFVRVPFDVPDDSRHTFLSRVQSECLPLSAVLGPIEWHDKTQ